MNRRSHPAITSGARIVLAHAAEHIAGNEYAHNVLMIAAAIVAGFDIAQRAQHCKSR